MVMDLSALGHTLKPLIRDGLVELSQNKEDRRVKQVRLTPLGMDKFMDATRLWQAAQANFECAFGIERSKELRSVLGYVASDEFVDAFLAKRA
jgi:DNA-binding MarR family transcriptional regulator